MASRFDGRPPFPEVETELTRVPSGLSCPGCRRPVSWSEGAGHCPGCGRQASLWGGRIPDFLGIADRPAATILDWSDGVLPLIERGLLDIEMGRLPADGDWAGLEAWGLADSDGRLTNLGQKVAYHLAEHRRQESGNDFIATEVLDRAGLGADARVLDVGCGAGQSLRQLAPRRPIERIGLDADAGALALGSRLADVTGEDIRFIHATAHALPFSDARFTHVLSRVALNYMHQRLALVEMARVLRPGGVLYCRFEGPGQDLFQMARVRHAGRALRYLFELALGLGLELTGRQLVPGSRYTGGRAFATARRIGRVLLRNGCEIISVSTLRSHGGLSRSVEILAEKRGDRGIVMPPRLDQMDSQLGARS